MTGSGLARWVNGAFSIPSLGRTFPIFVSNRYVPLHLLSIDRSGSSRVAAISTPTPKALPITITETRPPILFVSFAAFCSNSLRCLLLRPEPRLGSRQPLHSECRTCRCRSFCRRSRETIERREGPAANFRISARSNSVIVRPRVGSRFRIRVHNV
jgi:hypothetical protein